MFATPSYRARRRTATCRATRRSHLAGRGPRLRAATPAAAHRGHAPCRARGGGNPPLAVVAQAGLPQRETRDQRLARTIAAEAGRGDCNKGQFLGGGMGPQSSFWVAAEATGQCAK